jgi:hypothetical protein
MSAERRSADGECGSDWVGEHELGMDRIGPIQDPDEKQLKIFNELMVCCFKLCARN